MNHKKTKARNGRCLFIFLEEGCHRQPKSIYKWQEKFICRSILALETCTCLSRCYNNL